MAEIVSSSFPGEVEVEHVENPRVEIEHHHYSFAHTALESLGLRPHLLSENLWGSMFEIIDQHRDRDDAVLLRPTVQWRQSARTHAR